MSIDGAILVVARQNPLDDFIIVGVAELDLEPLRPPLEPAVAALHIAVAVGQVQLPGLRLDVAGLRSVATRLPDIKEESYITSYHISHHLTDNWTEGEFISFLPEKHLISDA